MLCSARCLFKTIVDFTQEYVGDLFYNPFLLSDKEATLFLYSRGAPLLM